MKQEPFRDGKVIVESEKGSGGASKRRPIYAFEKDGGFFPDKYTVAAEINSENEICKLMGNSEAEYGQGLVYYNDDEKMLYFETTENRWIIQEANDYYISKVTCK